MRRSVSDGGEDGTRPQPPVIGAYGPGPALRGLRRGDGDQAVLLVALGFGDDGADELEGRANRAAPCQGEPGLRGRGALLVTNSANPLPTDSGLN